MTIKIKKKKRKQFYDIEKDGITQSLLSMWLSCRQKARIYLKGYERPFISQALMHGAIGHKVLELMYTDVMKGKINKIPSSKTAKKYVDIVEKIWLKENPKANEYETQNLELCLGLVEAMIQPYFKHWRKDFIKVNWVSLEEKFQYPITLPDGRKTVFRGKKDGVFNPKTNWLFETKFKALVNEVDMIDVLEMDFQVLSYLLTLIKGNKYPKGCVYNVIRRPSLRKKQNESMTAFIKRCQEDMFSRPDHYFIRIPVFIEPELLISFREEFLAVITEFYDWYEGKAPHYKNPYECIGKYGRCPNIFVCSKGEYSGLRKRQNVFTELEGDL